MRFIKLALLAVAALLSVGQLEADIIGGSDLVTQSDLTKLEGWLGEGSLDINDIFNRENRDRPLESDFHAAVNGKERTFTLIEVVMEDEPQNNSGRNETNPFICITGSRSDSPTRNSFSSSY